MFVIHGIPAAKGIAIGPGYYFKSARHIPSRVRITDVNEELKKLEKALQQAEMELENVYAEARQSAGEETAQIFQAHLLMLKDPDLLETVRQTIQTEGINAEAAYYEASEVYVKMLQDLSDEYLKARVADIQDVSARVIRILSNEKAGSANLLRPSIVYAEDLSPSDTIQFKREYLLGLFTAKGGTTSHTAILSRMLGIPAIVGAGELPSPVSDESTFILDGSSGKLIIEPDEPTLSRYQQQQHLLLKKQREDRDAALAQAVTHDGKHVKVVANIGNLADAKTSLQNGAEGVGLFRTEFSYLEQPSVPDEEKLLRVYREIFQVFGDKPIVVRTLDIGGDKEVPHLGLPVEANAFLGHRGIRLCLSRPDLFRPQLRAILQAGSKSNLRIMFPMVATIGEIRQARKILDECKAELRSEKVEYNEDPQIGIMIEVPSAVICADQMAKEVDFFSIGTNDLTQYTMAADRTNKNVSYLVSALQPAVLRLIKQVIDQGHDASIWVGMCGEMAGEPMAIPVLLGLGLDEFSMNSPEIPQAKEIFSKWDTRQAKSLAYKALLCETPEDVETLVANWPLPL